MTVKITAYAGGPYVIEGAVELVGPDGAAIATDGKVALCRCGLSKTKPLCDGTHKTSDFDK